MSNGAHQFPDDPLGRLRYLLEAYDRVLRSTPDALVLRNPNNGFDHPTGLTWSDLEAIARLAE